MTTRDLTATETPLHKTLPEALAAAQGELTNVGLDGKGNYGKYMTLPNLIAAVRPVLARHGLSWSALPAIGEDGRATMRYQLLHISGEVIAGEMALMMSKQDAQGQGSALTYARRYSLAAVLNIGADEDDDGAHAAKVEQRNDTRRGNGSAPPAGPLLDAAKVDEILAAWQGAKAGGMNSEWLRQQLIGVGAANVPEGQLMRSTLEALTPEQAEQIIGLCSEAAAA